MEDDGAKQQSSRELSELPVSPPDAVGRGDVDIKELFTVGFPVEQQRQVLSEYEERRRTFRSWLEGQLVEGVHYGYPPGTLPKRKKINGRWHFEMWSRGGTQWVPETQWKHKPSLYKSGAQLLVDLFQLRAEYRPSLDGWKMMGGAAGDMVAECVLISPKTGKQVGQGLGAASRQKPDKDYDGKSMNAAVKMANKRALVAAVLETFGLSDLFTQDIEDASPPETQVENPRRADSAPDVKPRESGSDPGPRRKPGEVTTDDIRKLYSDWKKALGESGKKLDGQQAIEAFAEWCRAACSGDFADVIDAAEWTPSDLSAARFYLEQHGAGGSDE